MLRKFLCFTIPAPPADVITTLDPIPEGTARTTREHFELTHRRPDCASCHDRSTRAGYTLENYDALGRFVTEENGVPVNSSGGLPLGSRAPDAAINGGVALGDVLAQRRGGSQLSRQSLVPLRLRPAADGSRATAARSLNLAKSIESGAGDPRALLLALVQSTSFRKRPAVRAPSSRNTIPCAR